MSKREQVSCEAKGKSRREFMRDGALGTAGLAAGMTMAGMPGSHADEVKKTRSYNRNMEYRPLGKTGLWISACCLGGHWKRVNEMVPEVFESKGWLSAKLDDPGFIKNRHDVVSRCIKRGINYIDACTWQEVVTYGRALKGRRDKMYLGFSWYQEEMRKEPYRNAKALLGTLDKGMKEAGLDYVDLWRITMLSTSSKHTDGEVEEMMTALAKAKEQGKVRLTGLSSHDRPHIKWMIETYPEVVQVIVTPYTAESTELPTDSLFETLREYKVGMFGIKPFAGTSLFKGNSAPDSPDAKSDDRLARLAIRYILSNDAITAPIPGMINKHQVDNVADAIKERKKLDVAEAKELKDAMKVAMDNLPPNYEWLRDCKHV